jgi:predicted esterase
VVVSLAVACASLMGNGNDRLTARPPVHPSEAPTTTEAPARGLQPLTLGEPRPPLLYVPSTYDPARPAALVAMLHGGGGDPRGGLEPFLRLADDRGLILLAPASRDRTWDVVGSSFGPDVGAIDRALGQVFARYRVDRSRVAIEGFSDGASYALSLGLANGDLFTHVIAFSPGFVAPGTRRGKPRIFLTHGIHDKVLPIASTSRSIVRELRDDGYDVNYREFDGPHVVPPELAEQAVGWFLGR